MIILLYADTHSMFIISQSVNFDTRLPELQEFYDSVIFIAVVCICLVFLRLLFATNSREIYCKRTNVSSVECIFYDTFFAERSMFVVSVWE